MEKIIWTTQRRKISDLIPNPRNPRQMSEEQVNHLKQSLLKFDLVEIPAIDTDNMILAGHQRLKIMAMLGRGEEEIDVRVPNRKLTEDEAKEYNIRSNLNTGSFDNDILANDYEESQLKEYGFTDEQVNFIYDRSPNFSPTGGDDQSNLDSETPIKCPSCGHEFHLGDED